MNVAPTWLKWLLALWFGFAALTPAAASATDAMAGAWNYQIVQGDTLIGISAQLLERPDDWPILQKLNRIANPRRLPPGGTIRIPFDLLKKSAMVATVIFVRGRVTLSSTTADSNRPERPLALGDGVRSLDVVSTNDDASLSLRFVDGSRLMIGPASQVSVVRMLEIGRSALPDALFNVDHGSAEIHIVPNAGRRFELRTPAMNLGVRGTSFRVRVDAKGKAAGVEVLEGRVAAAAGRDQKVPVNAGFGTLAQAGQPIAPPRLLLPPPVLAASARLIEYLPMRFAWPSIPGAVAYRVQVLANTNDERLLLDGRFAQASAQFASLPDGSYRLRVRGIDTAGLEGLDTVQPFVLKAQPQAPLAVSPKPGATSVGAAARFEWAGVNDAKRYRLQIARDTEFADLVFDNAAISQTSQLVELAPGRYHWRLASIAETREGRDDAGPFGEAQTFEQRDLPPPLPLAEPLVGADGVRLRWDPPTTGRSVRLQIAEDADFRKMALDRTVSEASELLAELGPGRYYARARLVSADGLAGDFGPVQQFDVPLPPIAPWWALPLGWLLL
ncbi:MAG: FecR domain-containing protein [Ideonella sp.]